MILLWHTRLITETVEVLKIWKGIRNRKSFDKTASALTLEGNLEGQLAPNPNSTGPAKEVMDQVQIGFDSVVGTGFSEASLSSFYLRHISFDEGKTFYYSFRSIFRYESFETSQYVKQFPEKVHDDFFYCQVLVIELFQNLGQ